MGTQVLHQSDHREESPSTKYSALFPASISRCTLLSIHGLNLWPSGQLVLVNFSLITNCANAWLSLSWAYSSGSWLIIYFRKHVRTVLQFTSPFLEAAKTWAGPVVAASSRCLTVEYLSLSDIWSIITAPVADSSSFSWLFSRLCCVRYLRKRWLIFCTCYWEINIGIIYGQGVAYSNKQCEQTRETNRAGRAVKAFAHWNVLHVALMYSTGFRFYRRTEPGHVNIVVLIF